MKTKIAIPLFLATVSLWAFAQTNDMNNGGPMPDSRPAHGGKKHDAENTNFGSEYGNTNRWPAGTNGWNHSDDGTTGTNRYHWKKEEGQTDNPPQN